MDSAPLSWKNIRQDILGVGRGTGHQDTQALLLHTELLHSQLESWILSQALWKKHLGRNSCGWFQRTNNPSVLFLPWDHSHSPHRPTHIKQSHSSSSVASLCWRTRPAPILSSSTFGEERGEAPLEATGKGQDVD